MTAELVAPAPDVRDEWTEQAEATLRARVDSARALRDVGPLPPIEHGPVPLVGHLVQVRAAMDQVETLLSEVSRFRTNARVLLKEASAAVDDKWAERVTEPRVSRRASFDGSFDTAPREKYAAADLAVLDDRRKARRRGRIMDACDDAVDQIRLAHRGLDGVRMDLHALMRGLSVEQRLER